MSAGQLLKQANQLKRAGRLDEAIALYHQLIEINPNFAWAYNNLGDAFVKQGNFDEAAVEYQKAIEINPNSAWFNINLGRLFIEQGCFEEAIGYFRQAVQSKHNLLCELNGKHEECASNLSALTVNNELFPENLYFREETDSQWQFGDLDNLAKLTPETLRNQPERSKVAVFVAIAHLYQGDIQAARHCIGLARDWGLSQQSISQIIVSGLHKWFACSATFTGVRNFWYIGDWEALVQLDKADLFQRPERAKLALLVAAGYQQLGNINALRRCTDLALEWGCSNGLVYRVLTSGIYNLFGRGAAVARRYKVSLKYFKSAFAVMEIADNLQGTLLKSRIKMQIGQIPSLNNQRVINLVLNSDK
ncbi:MAG: tetratricopeptide repeat protein [Okeania sp. SIO2B3]|nr:tetratricopeptide repeat protein [Okeania sp. SIO2B3]